MAQRFTQASAGRTARRHDLDALRGIGAMLVVLAHCALVFSPWTEVVQISPQHKLFSELVWFLNPWLMPLFMLLAGASAFFALRRRTDAQYLRERAGLLLALLVGVFVFVIPSVYIMRATEGKFQGSLLSFYPHYFEGIQPAGNFTLLHLWFLAYVVVYALITLPLFRCLQGTQGRALTGRLAELSGRRGGLLLMALPLVVLQLGFAGRFPDSEFPVIVNDGFRFFTLLYFFICGYIFISDERFARAGALQWRTMLIVALAGSAYLFAVAWSDSFNPRQDVPLSYSWSYIAYHTAFILSGWSWSMVLLALARRTLARPHPVVAYLGRASLVVYLVHPVFWLMGILALGTVSLPAPVEFLGLTVFDALTSLGTYEVLHRLRSVQRTPAPAPAALYPRLGPARVGTH